MNYILLEEMKIVESANLCCSFDLCVCMFVFDDRGKNLEGYMRYKRLGRGRNILLE